MTETRPEPIRVLIVEDHEIVRMGLRLSLKHHADFKIVGEAADGLSAIAKAAELAPDIILMDIGLPSLSGIDAAKKIKQQLPTIKVLMVTSYETDDAIFASLSAGVDGYCLKTTSIEQLALAMHAVFRGESWLDPRIAEKVYAAQQTAGAQRTSKQEGGGKFGLTPREQEVLASIVQGLNNQEIAEKLGIGAETVKTHVSHLINKMTVADRTQAAVKAIKDGYFT